MIHSFLLIGQSNMAGRGLIEEAIPVNTDKIKILRNGRWQPMFRPVNPDRAFSGVCLAESFAEKYAEKYGVEAGLIPCADGGTRLEQWQEGGLLYDNALFQARLATRTSTIVGVLWHQGESDCADGLRETYCVRFEKIIRALRRDLGLQNTPFLLGGLGDFLADCTADIWVKNYQEVNTQLKKVVARNKKMAFVSAIGLHGKSDNLHFDAKSLYEFGIRYFEEFEKIYNPSEVYFNDTDAEIARTEMEKL